MLNGFEVKILEFLTKLDELLGGFEVLGASIATWFWWLITQFGDKFLLIAIILLIYWCINKEKGEKITYTVMTSLAVNTIVKNLFNRERPYLIEDGKYANVRKLERLDGVGKSSSFPSGHSQNASTLFSSIAVNFRNPYTLIFGILIIILVPISRMYLGVHYPTDTVVGVLLGLFVTYICYLLMSNFYRNKFVIYFITLGLMTPFLFIGRFNTNTYFMIFGLYLGFIIGVLFENKFVDFTCDVPIKNKVLRYVAGVSILLVIYLFSELVDNLMVIDILSKIWTLISYSLMAFVSFGLVPLMFKRNK